MLSEHRLPAPDVPLFELEPWREMGFRAGITGRDGDFDLGLFAGGPARSVLGNWLRFAASMRPAFPAIAVAHQVHGSKLLEHAERGTGWLVREGFDGHLTSRAGLLLTVTVADCIPVYLAHPPSASVALLHAGWRGIASGILEAGIQALCSASRCQPREIVMHCGVGICGDCYEVGHEVIKELTGRSVREAERIDLRTVLAERAFQAGVRDVTVSSWCSAHDTGSFFSHRRSRGLDGRMVAYLGVPLAP